MSIAHDNSIRDPQELQRIEESILGKRSKVRVRFFQHAARDAKAEAQQRDRIEAGSTEIARPFFKMVPYIERRHQDQKDYMSRIATEQDRRDHPKEWAEFQEATEKPPKHAIELLPGNNVVTLAIFDELNILYIEDFLEFAERKPEILEIFSELLPLFEAAKRWRTFMKPRLKLVEGKAQ